VSSAPAPFVSRLLAVARERPDAHAIDSGDGRPLTYRALINAASGVAQALGEHGIERQSVVALTPPRSAEWVVGLLGCFFAGAVPLPIDPSLPTMRRRTYVARAGARFALALGGTAPDLDVPTLALDLATLGRERVTTPAPTAHDDLAWLLYTSGTTGEPKGVLVEHGGVVPLLDAQIEAFRIDARSRCLWALSTAFDASLSDVGTALLVGATLSIAPDLELADPARLFAVMRDRGITHVDLPPALLPHLDPDRRPQSLSTIVIGGEVADAEAVRRWAPHVRLVNVYGPTEATICTSLCVCDASWDRPLLGEPIANAVYRIEDEAGMARDEGELLIGGPGVARGYLGMDVLTRERFVMRGGSRFFRTGDRVRRDSDGAFVFVGRLDRQVKVRGQLVAPEEIEVCLRSHPAVGRAAVTMEPVLVAHVEASLDLSVEALRAHVSARLPGYMVPSRFEVVRRLPTTPSGKVDLSALPAAPPGQKKTAGPTAGALGAIVREVLGLARADPDLGFASLGGTSLSALEVVARAEALGLSLDAEQLQAAPSLSALARELDAPPQSAARTTRQLERRAAPLLGAMPHDTETFTGGPASTILVTGATGFLGARVVRELLRRTSARIVCLARDGALDAAARVRASLEAVGPYDASRIEVARGDLSRDRLGLETDRYAELASVVDHVVHAAARVSATAPLDALYSTNVEGTARTLCFAATTRAKRFTYASTLSVFVGTDDREGVFEEAQWPRADARVFGGYAQSKVAAESLVRSAAAHLAGVQIIRYGLLTGDAATGRAAPGAWLDRTIRGLSALGAVPRQTDPGLCFDVTPVDYAAAATARLVAVETGQLSTFHLANGRTVSFGALLGALRDEGVTLSVVSREAFMGLVAERACDASGVDVGAACLALGRTLGPSAAARHRGLDLFEATRARFDDEQARAVLDGDPVCPAPTPALLRRYVRAALGEAS